MTEVIQEEERIVPGYGMTSKDSYDRYEGGQREDSVDFVEWANDYQHYVAIRSEMEKHLRDVA